MEYGWLYAALLGGTVVGVYRIGTVIDRHTQELRKIVSMLGSLDSRLEQIDRQIDSLRPEKPKPVLSAWEMRGDH